MELSPVNANEARTIDAYRPGGFTVGGLRLEGAVLLIADGVHPWPVSAIEELTEAAADALAALAPAHDLLILGTGAQMVFPTKAVRLRLREAGLSLETMTTPAACRTYNVLLGEGRAVAAALLPVSEASG